jgi:thiamine-monophosphate kinase
MPVWNLEKRLRFYFITDEGQAGPPPLKQAELAIRAGAGVIQYRKKSVSPQDFAEVSAIRQLCRTCRVLFVVNDDIFLAKAVAADGVHVGQEDERPALARAVLGPRAVIGVSVSTLAELDQTDLSSCDYIGAGPVFATSTKVDAKPVIGLSGLKAIIDRSPVPVVAIGGIDEIRAVSCFNQGAAGVAVISRITRDADPAAAALAVAAACGCAPRAIPSPWDDEFGLIHKILAPPAGDSPDARHELESSIIEIPAGDDAALLRAIAHPVITTDCQKENIHFRLDWMSPEAIGERAVEVTFSDLAASCAKPLALFVNVSIPPHPPESVIVSIYEGIKAALARHNAILGGGNVSSGSELSLDLFAVGQGRPEIFPRRSNALPGDGLYVTGPLGLARAGLECLEHNDAGLSALIEKFTSPRARFDAAWVLAENGVRCIMDISDGLAGDAGHIAAASGISIEFDTAGFRVPPDLGAFCRKYDRSPHQMMLSGGDDYELLFACRPERFEQIRPLLPEAFPVGRCIAFAGRSILNLDDGIRSFIHGSKAAKTQKNSWTNTLKDRNGFKKI